MFFSNTVEFLQFRFRIWCPPPFLTVKFQEELAVFIEPLLFARHYFKYFMCNNDQGRVGVVMKRKTRHKLWSWINLVEIPTLPLTLYVISVQFLNQFMS